MRRLLLAAICFGVLIVGCATTWPDACPVVTDVRRCKCAVLTFKITNHPDGKPAPAGVVGLSCDGQPLPVTVIGEAVVK